MPRLKAEKVKRIKTDLCKPDATQPAVAKKHRVSRSTVSDIATGRTHKNVPWPDGGPPKKRSGGQRKPITDYDPTDARILELEADIAHLTEERNRERRKVKAGARDRGLFKAMADVLTEKIVPVNPLPRVRRPAGKKGKTIEEHVVMHISDMHADQVVRPEECGGLEEYNFPIACARAERYVDTVLQWTQETLAPQFRFPVLTVLAYGDFTSGEIHGHAARSYYRNQFKNCLAIGQLQALMFRDLAPHFDQVNVVYVPGNHGRRTPKKDYHGAHDNFDYLVAETARMHCRKLQNIQFLIPNAFSVNLDINGVGFNVSHGDDVRSNLGVPFYGMVRRQKGLIALGAMQGGPRTRYFCMGHHHTASSLGDIDGELIVNGAWLGTDSFAYNAFSGYREPSQWLHGVNQKYGITWRLNVKLKHKAEKKGPRRYLIDGGRDVGPLP